MSYADQPEMNVYDLYKHYKAECDRLRAGIIKARDALDNYDYDTSLFAIMSELDELLGDTNV